MLIEETLNQKQKKSCKGSLFKNVFTCFKLEKHLFTSIHKKIGRSDKAINQNFMFIYLFFLITVHICPLNGPAKST